MDNFLVLRFFFATKSRLLDFVTWKKSSPTLPKIDYNRMKQPSKVFPKFQLSWKIFLIRLIILHVMHGLQIVTHLSISHGLACLTSVNWPFPSLLGHTCIVQMLAISRMDEQ